jgi:hypothetical protein
LNVFAIFTNPKPSLNQAEDAQEHLDVRLVVHALDRGLTRARASRGGRRVAGSADVHVAIDDVPDHLATFRHRLACRQPDALAVLLVDVARDTCDEAIRGRVELAFEPWSGLFTPTR